MGDHKTLVFPLLAKADTVHIENYGDGMSVLNIELLTNEQTCWRIWYRRMIFSYHYERPVGRIYATTRFQWNIRRLIMTIVVLVITPSCLVWRIDGQNVILVINIYGKRLNCHTNRYRWKWRGAYISGIACDDDANEVLKIRSIKWIYTHKQPLLLTMAIICYFTLQI